MHHRFLLVLSSLMLLASLPPLHAQAPSPQLNAVLAQMDTASKTFKNASARFEWDFYEKVVRDTTKQSGTMYLERAGAGTNFGATVYDLDANGKPGPTPSKIILFGNGALRVYSPAEKQEDDFKSQASYEGYLSLGFGGSGHDLAQAWDITDGGPETLTENGHPVKVERLILVSKDPAVRNNFSKATLWIDPIRDVSLKQVFDLPSGDQRTAFYTDIRLNSTLNKSAYKIPAKGVTVVPH